MKTSSLLNDLGYCIWICGLLLLSAIAIIMLRRRLHREMPVFFAAMVYEVAHALVLLGMIRIFPSAYATSYWGSEFISIAFEFGIVYELISKAFCEHERIQKLNWILAKWISAIFLLIAVASISSTMNPRMGFIAFVQIFERSLRVFQVGLIVFLFMFVSVLSLRWKHYALGIALGFGVYAAVNLAVVVAWRQAAVAGNTVYMLLKPGSYFCAILIWITFLVVPAPQSNQVSVKFDDDLEEWNRTLAEFLKQ